MGKMYYTLYNMYHVPCTWYSLYRVPSIWYAPYHVPCILYALHHTPGYPVRVLVQIFPVLSKIYT